MKKTIFNFSVLLLAIVISLSGCVEHRYYQEHHYHTSGYYHRHHMTPPPGVEIEIRH